MSKPKRPIPSKLVVPNFDMVYHNVTTPIVVNDIPFTTEEEREAFNAVIMVTYTEDVLSSVPSCACGAKTTAYYLDDVCDRCHTLVRFPAEDDLDLRTWIRVPEGISGFVSPLIWTQLTNILNSRGYNLLDWLTDARSKPPKNIPVETARRIEYLTKINWPRGLNNFIANFDQFLELIPLFVKGRDPRNKAIKYIEFLKTIRERIFPQYLTLPTKAMLILENMPNGVFADSQSITGAIDAARTIAHISIKRLRPLSAQHIETKTVSVINNLVKYYNATIKNTLCSKKGWLRGQVFRSRSHFSCRGVITSLHVPHYREEMHIPWAQGLEMFKIHIVSKLVRRGWAQNVAFHLVENSGNMYNKLIDDVIHELIREAPKVNRKIRFDEYYNIVNFDMNYKIPESAIYANLQRN